MVDQMKKINATQTFIDYLIVILITVGIFISGGNPISPVVYQILEKAYGVKVPTYNIAELLEITERGNASLEKRLACQTAKIEVASFKDFEDLLLAKKIPFINISSTTKNEMVIRVEQFKNVNNLKVLVQLIKTNNITVSSKYLNDEEAIVTLRREKND